eukprot:4200634-Amphidinium_carterae.1
MARPVSVLRPIGVRWQFCEGFLGLLFSHTQATDDSLHSVPPQLFCWGRVLVRLCLIVSCRRGCMSRIALLRDAGWKKKTSRTSTCC